MHSEEIKTAGNKQIFVEERVGYIRKKWAFLCLIISYRLVAEIPRVFKETKGQQT